MSQTARFSPGQQEDIIKHVGFDGPNKTCLKLEKKILPKMSST